MSSVNIDLAADTILNVMVGQQDENEVREVVFDFSDWYTTYGSGTISLAIQRPKDEWPYEGTLTVDNSTHKATWEISDTDSAYAGVGQIQLSYTVGTAVKKSVVYRFTVHKSLGALGNVITPIQIQTFIDEVTEALEDMQEELNDVKQDLAEFKYGGGGLTDEARYALLECFSKLAWIDGDGQDYYDTLEATLFPVAVLTSITAVYTQSGAIYVDTSLDDLKSDLVVTAHYDDGSTQTVTNYTLSGTLEAGTSTITVSYVGKTTTFNVTVSAPLYPFYNGSYTFSTYPYTVQVTNGNKAYVEGVSNENHGVVANISNILGNTTTSNSADNKKNGGNTYFTLHAGETISIEVTIDSVLVKDTTYEEFTVGVSDTIGNTIIGIKDSSNNNYKLKDVTEGESFTASYTAESDINVSCIILFYGNFSTKSAARHLGISVKAFIDDIRII